jgi:hypothetical protein
MGKQICQIYNREDQLDYLFGGNATFTVKNTKTENAFTYQVSVFGELNELFSVKVQHEEQWLYLGTIFKRTQFSLTSKSRLSFETLEFRVFAWLLDKLITSGLPECVIFFHTGRCARCGGALTTKESLLAGFGKTCSNKKGLPILSDEYRTWDQIAYYQASKLSASA